MPLTMVRVNLVEGVGPVMQIAEGKSITLPEDVHKKIDDRTDPTWPTTWFVPRTTGEGAFRDVYSVMANWGANHGAFIHGHVGADLITLASMLRIPVVMHNVEEERIFRPHALGKFWNRDIRSCGHGCMQGLRTVVRLTVKRKSRENFLNNNILSMVRSKGGFQISNLYDCYNWDLFH